MEATANHRPRQSTRPSNAIALPSAVDAEQQVIGSLLLSPEKIAIVARTLRSRDFFDAQHREVYAAILAMNREGVLVDVATLLARLKASPKFDSPAAYLAETGRSVITAANVGFHADRVAEASRKRRIHAMAIETADAALKGRPADDVLADLIDGADDLRREANRSERFTAISAAELATGDYRLTWLVEGLLVEGQPCIVAGGKKTLKTSMLLDLLLSIAIGGDFLAKFKVRTAQRVIFLSGESGLPTLQETAFRIARSKGWALADVPNFTLSTDLPRLDSPDDLAALETFIERVGAEVVAIDPAYLCMPGGDAGNLFTQGALLLELSRICQRQGVTLLLAHHTRKGRSADMGAFDPPELEDIAWAGFQEFARQWLLVGRRERYAAGTGEHRLWLNHGGSAGHGGLWAIDINEGVSSDAGGRHWDVRATKAADALEQADQRRADAKARQLSEQLEVDKRAICDALAAMPDATATKTELRERIGLNSKRFNSALASLLQNCDVTTAEKTKGNGRRYDALKLSEGWS